MCDTMVALPSATRGGSVLFAKNSDRERNEAQFLQLIPAWSHPAGQELRCSHISIPQVEATQAVLLSRPFWSWGAEMGTNAAGVVIGNEAIFARLPPNEALALTGMDLVRLALERASSAASAVEVIIALLERHGQGGNCGHLHEHFYDNSFLVADRHEAYVVETIGRFWVVERTGPIRAISNALSIGSDDVLRISPALVADARARGWLGDGANPDVAELYLDVERDAQTCGCLRRSRATSLLQRRAGALAVPDMMAVLRDHGEAAERVPRWHPAMTVGRSICMHAGGPERRGQSVGSLVSELRPDGQAVHWVTGTAAPCTSLFRPVLMDAPLPSHGARPSDRYDPATLWWRHETVHRAAVLGDFAAALDALVPERDALEVRFAARMDEALETSGPGAYEVRRAAVAACWAEADAWETRRAAMLRHQTCSAADAPFNNAWRHLAQAAGWDVSAD